LTPIAWRKLIRQPGGVSIALLLVVLLAFDGHACAMGIHEDLASSAETHHCCSKTSATADPPEDSSPPSCHDGSCLETLGYHDAIDPRGPPAGDPDWSIPPPAASLLPPDWLGSVHRPPALTAETTGPPPPQRSRVLRL
jgi:hypothetical protein